MLSENTNTFTKENLNQRGQNQGGKHMKKSIIAKIEATLTEMYGTYGR